MNGASDEAPVGAAASAATANSALRPLPSARGLPSAASGPSAADALEMDEDLAVESADDDANGSIDDLASDPLLPAVMQNSDVVRARLMHLSQWLQDRAQSQMDEFRRPNSFRGNMSSTSEDASRLLGPPLQTGPWTDVHGDGVQVEEEPFSQELPLPPRSRRRGESAASSRSTRGGSVTRRESNSSMVDIVVDDNGHDDEEARTMPAAGVAPGTRNNEPGQQAPPQTSVPPPRRAGSTTDDESEDQTAMAELQNILRRCHHSLPFLALFLIYFAYQHTTGILVFLMGTIVIMGLDQRIRKQIALKENASGLRLVVIVLMCVLDMSALCFIDGDANPYRHFLNKINADASENGLFWEVMWAVLVNDFIIRLCSVIVKALVASVKAESVCCFKRPNRTQPSRSTTTNQACPTEGADVAVEIDSSEPSRAPSSVTFYRRKRKLYGIIEMSSIFLRSLLAGVPWCNYYQLCSSKLMADLFTFSYIFIKGLILGTQGRKIITMVHSFITLGLDFGTYVTHDELAEAGSPDCSICYEPMNVPVKLSCTHMFCEECVMEWFDRERSCPLCRAAISLSSGTGAGADESKPQFLDGSTSLLPQLL